MKRLTSLLAALALTGGVLAAGPTASASAEPAKRPPHQRGHHKARSYTPPPIEWGTCESQRMRDAGARCGLLTVPLNYRRPRGPKVKIGVSEIKHTVPEAAYQGIMLVNPGGPGGSGLNLARLGASVPNHAGDAYDWIGFDPRGVGISQPALRCDLNYFPANRPDYVPFNRGVNRFWKAKTRRYARACDATGGRLLNRMRTVDWVHDMESIRKAFGQQQINFYGFSYGTYLGQVYATQHPRRVRRMVFDGVVNPRRVWYRANLDQDRAFNRSINIFFTWVAAHDSTYHLGTTGDQVRTRWYAMRNQARQAPLGGDIGPAEWTDAFLSAGYYVYGWEDSARTFADAVAGDYSAVQAAYAEANGSDDNTYAAYLAVQCTDVRWPGKWRRWRKDSWRLHRRAPFMTWSNTWYNAPCRTWGAKPARRAAKVQGKRVPPILMIGESNDAATPISGALAVRRLFPRSVLIEGAGGTTHSGSLSGVSCTDDRIAAYLATGAVDGRKRGRRSDVVCPPVPRPGPNPSARMGRTAGGPALPADLREIITRAATPR